MKNHINKLLIVSVGIILCGIAMLTLTPDIQAQSPANRRPYPVELDQLVGVVSPLQTQIDNITNGTTTLTTATATTVNATTVNATTVNGTTVNGSAIVATNSLSTSNLTVSATFNAAASTSTQNTVTNLLTISATGGIKVLSGAGGTAGKVALAAGAATVSTTNIAAGDLVIVTLSPSTVVGVVPYVSNIVAGTSFQIVSTNTANATNTAYWFIVKQ